MAKKHASTEIWSERAFKHDREIHDALFWPDDSFARKAGIGAICSLKSDAEQCQGGMILHRTYLAQVH